MFTISKNKAIVLLIIVIVLIVALLAIAIKIGNENAWREQHGERVSECVREMKSHCGEERPLPEPTKGHPGGERPLPAVGNEPCPKQGTATGSNYNLETGILTIFYKDGSTCTRLVPIATP